jgi:hypothetical protein
MANADSKKGFQIRNDRTFYTRRMKVAAGYLGRDGDAVFLDAAGRATLTPGDIAGLQKGRIEDLSEGRAISIPEGTPAAVDDEIIVYYEPHIQFTGQMSTGALTDTSTTSSAAAAFDIDNSTPGQNFVDAGASVRDEIKVVEDTYAEDDGEQSEPGAFQKKVFMFNLAKHYLGTKV